MQIVMILTRALQIRVIILVQTSLTAPIHWQLTELLAPQLMATLALVQVESVKYRLHQRLHRYLNLAPRGIMKTAAILARMDVTDACAHITPAVTLKRLQTAACLAVLIQSAVLILVLIISEYVLTALNVVATLMLLIVF
jgi:hypothetical protein